VSAAPVDPALVAALIARDKGALGRAVTRFEDGRAAAAAERAALLAALPERRAPILGLTGAPGVGKSSLIAELGPRLVARGAAVAVVAVDPSSPTSGGALLGDRARTRFAPDERRLFFRSQASALELGGLGPTTHAVARLLVRLFDLVVIETVGVGQSEVEVSHLADATALVVQPMAGDELQYLKAGVVEVADRVILTKCDLDHGGAAAQLRAALALGRATPPPIAVVSARTGEGLDALADSILALPVDLGAQAARDARWFARWVAQEYGRQGAAVLARTGGPEATLAAAGTFEDAQAAFAGTFRQALAAD
jgi:LAO/AO transport system kinase